MVDSTQWTGNPENAYIYNDWDYTVGLVCGVIYGIGLCFSGYLFAVAIFG